MACNKGSPPCIGIELRKKLSAHFCIIDTPEHYTSKTCSFCNSVCGPCHEVDARRKEEKLRKLREEGCEDERRIRKARWFSVRGLRRCQNNECAAYLNRDHNAAINIQRRCSALLQEEGEADRLLDRLVDDVDRDMRSFEQRM